MSRKILKAWLVEEAYFSHPHELPMLKKTHFKPKEAIPFEKRNTTKKDQWLHFYTFDHHFECLWNNPKKYLGLLKKYSGVITPDYSVYRDYPLSVQIWNTYRNRALAYWMQEEGINIIPNIRWADERSYLFAFEGVEPGGTVAISTLGTIQNRADRNYFQKGLELMMETVAPETIICHGRAPDSIFKPYKKKAELIVIPSRIELVYSQMGGV